MIVASRSDSDSSELGMQELLASVHVVLSAADEAALIGTLASVDRPVVVSFLNQHGFNLAVEDPVFRRDLAEADFLLRDGVGMELCLKLLGRRPGLNANGTDLIPKVLQASRDKTVVVFGTSEPWLSRAVERMRPVTGQIVAIADGFQSQDHYFALVRRHRPDVVVLAMGMPRQERLAALLAQDTDWPVLIVNGGAILDFWSSRFPRAPHLVRSLRLEWLFRLVQEPRRLTGRYLRGGVAFLVAIVRLRLAAGTAKKP